MNPKPLHEPEQQEIERLVNRIRRADERVRQPVSRKLIPISADDADWAEQNQLPREFFEFFELQRIA